MHLTKLSDYQELRRDPKSHVDQKTLRRHAKTGVIPGAFQLEKNGGWWVDLETHDKIIRERISTMMPSKHCANDVAQDYTDPVVARILRGTD